jgi:alpha-beta hydrolase superfamily lysophospholipase
LTEHVEGRFAGSAGGQIFWQGWLPPAPPVGVVLIVHGIAEHGGRYAHVGRRFAEEGYATYVHDHRGHGRSDGTRGNVDRMSTVITDLETMIRSVAGRHPELPLFLYGHSMGGLIALAYLTGTPVDLRGVVLSASAVEVSVGSKAARAAAGVLSAVVPNLGVVALDASAMSRDPEVVRDYDTDPLNYRGKVRARTGAEMLVATQRAMASLDRVTVPLLLIHGSADTITGPAGTKQLADKVASTDVTLKIYDDYYHELHNEPDKETVFADVVRWLKEHG